jgi:RNA polymerase sigma factor (sigma-70 family)
MDRQLIDDIKDQNWPSFRKLYDIYADMALRTAVGITGDSEMARDAVQEAFIRVYRNIESFDIDRPFKPWFFRILINECNRLLRKEPRLISLSKAIDEDGMQIAAEEREDYSDLYHAIQSLKDMYRIPVVLKYLQGFSEKEIAEVLDINQNTVKSRLFKAREMLRKKLETGERRVGIGQ